MEPNWEPLENRLGRTRSVGFMYMGRINGINLYKHGITRTYIHLEMPGIATFQWETGVMQALIGSRN